MTAGCSNTKVGAPATFSAWGLSKFFVPVALAWRQAATAPDEVPRDGQVM